MFRRNGMSGLTALKVQFVRAFFLLTKTAFLFRNYRERLSAKRILEEICGEVVRTFTILATLNLLIELSVSIAGQFT